MRTVAWIATILLAVSQAWAARHFVNPDGLSYLDLSDDYLSGRWSAAFNGYWSPLYPLLIAGARTLFPLSRASEPGLAHALNAVTFIASLAAFEFLISEMGETLDSNAKLICAYSIFLLTGLSLITVSVITPDMLLACWCYLAAGLVLRVRKVPAGVLTSVSLGAALGAAYLTKTIMFPAALILFFILIATGPRTRLHMRALATAVCTFVLVSSPELIATTKLAGRPTFGETGMIAYARMVNAYPKFWVGDPAGSGSPGNPIQTLANSPAVYAFPTDKPHRSYPLWDEPAVWYTGMQPHFQIAEQFRSATGNLGIAVRFLGKLLIPLLVLLLAARMQLDRSVLTLALWPLAVVFLYLAVHIEPRLAGPWAGIGFTVVVVGVSVPLAAKGRRIALASIWLITTICLVSVGVNTARSFTSREKVDGTENYAQLKVARTLADLGILPGSRVAIVGDESDIYWTRIARVQVAFQIPLFDAATYWSLPEESRTNLNSMVSDQGAVAIVASWSRPPVGEAGWIRADDHFYVLPLSGEHVLVR